VKEFRDLLHGVREQGEWLAYLRAFWDRANAGIFRAFVWLDLTHPPTCSQHATREDAEAWCHERIRENPEVILAEVITPIGEYVHIDPAMEKVA
jgi:hypothetical protein